MTLDDAKQLLKESGYYVDNLWHIGNVKVTLNKNINDEDCQKILDEVLNNPKITQQIFKMIENKEFHKANVDDS